LKGERTWQLIAEKDQLFYEWMAAFVNGRYCDIANAIRVLSPKIQEDCDRLTEILAKHTPDGHGRAGLRVVRQLDAIDRI